MSNLTVKTFRNQLQTLLQPDLGKFANNQPGIWIGEKYPTGTPTGLICYIQAIPNQLKTQSVSGNLKAITETFFLSLVDFSQSGKDYVAMRKIQQEFSIASVDISPGNESRMQQILIRVRNTGFI
ncbi:MAG: hypothetical protein ACRCYP_00430 [Alphaproteobacteria bacterium]